MYYALMPDLGADFSSRLEVLGHLKIALVIRDMMNIPPCAPRRLRLTVQADQLSSSAGGGRFIRGFMKALLKEQELRNQFERIYILATQNEPLDCLGPRPFGVTNLKRRFPSRLRMTPLATLFGYALPSADVAYGPFYYVFPGRVRARVITMHDLSCFDGRYHPSARVQNNALLLTRMAEECDGVVCDSQAIVCEFRSRWPDLAHKAVAIYCGVSPNDISVASSPATRANSILAVGTIEPRKNYPVLLDAFERLCHENGPKAPKLIVIGNMGWMSEGVGRRLLALQDAGKCRWLQHASDEQLADAYGKAGVFSYLSLSEGFGYPPFEAAYARCPMVLSNASAVGEIWARHARCVDPLDVEAIIAGWKWALALSPTQREAVADSQEKRAREFTWTRAIHEYLEFWNRLVTKISDKSR